MDEKVSGGSLDRHSVDARPQVILVQGTWSLTYADWWKPGSEFYKTLQSGGLSMLNGGDPFSWSTDIDGLIGGNDDWQEAGKALRWYVQGRLGLLEPVTLIAHSHGGQVVLYAAAQGLRVSRLITVATPIRWDMRKTRQLARTNICHWTHLYGGLRDWWQVLGALGDWSLGLRREMPEADRNLGFPERGHSDLLDPQLWKDNQMFGLVDGLKP